MIDSLFVVIKPLKAMSLAAEQISGDEDFCTNLGVFLA